ncbi:MAG: mercuric reductase [Thermoleophilia bacterium]
MQNFDVIIIGAGQGGVPFARDAAAAGWKTALVERTHVGGTCINDGCTPTKTMIASARVAYLARRASDYGVATGKVSVDLETVRRRKQSIVESWRRSSEERLEATENLTFIRGSARFTGPHTLAVTLLGDQRHAGAGDGDGGRGRGGGRGGEGENKQLELTAPVIVVDTGSRPALPQITGLDKVPYLTSTSIMELSEVPRHLLILGGGPVAVEFAQMFRRFGSRVTLIERSGHLLPQEDQDVSEAVADILEEDGIELFTNSSAARATRPGATVVRVQIESPGGSQVLEGSHLLVAVGRSPNTEDLDLNKAGLRTTASGHIPVNERLETEVPGIYAIGDVNGGPAFTHISYDDYRVLKANLLENGEASTAGRLVPYVVFLDPQLGRVGLTEREARELGYEVVVARMPMSYVARALETDEARGFIKAVVAAQTGEILGAAVLGSEGGEIMAMLELAMLGGLTADVLQDAVFAHPTLAEALNNLFASVPKPSAPRTAAWRREPTSNSAESEPAEEAEAQRV